MKCKEVKRISNPDILANVVYNNFMYLINFPELQHTKQDIIKTLMLSGNMCYLVYDNKNKLIAYLIGDFRTLSDSRNVYYISYVYVVESYRGKKIGSQLMNILMRKCKLNGTNVIILTCDTHDKRLVNFYKRYGFVVDPVLGAGKRHEVFSLKL